MQLKGEEHMSGLILFQNRNIFNSGDFNTRTIVGDVNNVSIMHPPCQSLIDG